MLRERSTTAATTTGVATFKMPFHVCAKSVQLCLSPDENPPRDLIPTPVLLGIDLLDLGALHIGLIWREVRNSAYWQVIHTFHDECVDHQAHPQDSVIESQHPVKEHLQALLDAVAKLCQEFPFVLEIDAKRGRDAEDELPMRDGTKTACTKPKHRLGLTHHETGSSLIAQDGDSGSRTGPSASKLSFTAPP